MSTNDRIQRFACRSCGSETVEQVLDLGRVPPSDVFPQQGAPTPDTTWPLQLWFCTACKLIQLGPAAEPPPEQPGPVDSSTALAHAAATTARIVAEERLQAGSTFIEYDSGHGGSWRAFFAANGLAEIASVELQADVVADIHNLMHAPDLDAVLTARAKQVAPGGTLICEFFHGRPMVADCLADTIRHGHYVYLTATALRPALERHGMVLTSAHESPMFGGSLLTVARHLSDHPVVEASVAEVLAKEAADGAADLAGLRGLGDRARSVAEAFRGRIGEYAATGRSVAAYGAPSKAAVLLAISGVGRESLGFTVDRAPAKWGHRIPGAGIPIEPVEHLLTMRPDVVVILTWDIASEVVSQLASESDGLWDPIVFVPLPVPRELRLRGR